MKKLLITIFTLAFIGFFGALNVYSSQQEFSADEQECRVLAMEQEIA